MLLTGIMVDAAPGAQAIVLFGDSITDGNCSTLNMSRRYPDVLAERLQSSGHTGVAVLNAGISGARVLKDGMGENALARLDRDVLAQPHVKTMVMMTGPFGAVVRVRRGGVRKATPYQYTSDQAGERPK